MPFSLFPFESHLFDAHFLLCLFAHWQNLVFHVSDPHSNVIQIVSNSMGQRDFEFLFKNENKKLRSLCETSWTQMVFNTFILVCYFIRITNFFILFFAVFSSRVAHTLYGERYVSISILFSWHSSMFALSITQTFTFKRECSLIGSVRRFFSVVRDF